MVIFLIFAIVLSSLCVHQFHTSDDVGEWMDLLGGFGIAIGAVGIMFGIWKYYDEKEDKKVAAKNIAFFLTSILLVTVGGMGIHAHHAISVDETYEKTGLALSSIGLGLAVMSLVFLGMTRTKTGKKLTKKLQELEDEKRD